MIKPEEPVKEGLAVYWFPTGNKELQNSSLRESRTLQLYSQQCVTMGIVDVRIADRAKVCPGWKAAGGRAGAGRRHRGEQSLRTRTASSLSATWKSCWKAR